MAAYIQISVTTDDENEAKKISMALVENRLAACVQIVPIQSIYRWKDNIETAKEWRCVIKTTRELYRKVEQAILKEHSYELPEIIAVPIINGYASYLQWIDDETG